MIATVSTALVEEFHHEWLGIAAIVLAITHGATAAPRSIRKLGHTHSGRTRARNCVGAALAVLTCAGFIAQFTSALVLSKYAFFWLPPLDGSQLARSVHLACCYWTFALGFLHAGFQLEPLALHALSKQRWLKVALIVACLAGFASFVQLGLGPYFLLQVAFAAPDLARPTILAILEYCLTGLLFSTIGGATSYALRLRAA